MDDDILDRFQWPPADLDPNLPATHQGIFDPGLDWDEQQDANDAMKLVIEKNND